MSIKIGVIGAGSTYTPELVEGLIAQYARIPVSQLVLMDIDGPKLEIVGGLAQRMVRRAGLPIEVTLTADRLQAVAGADFVLTQLRVGRLPARRLDELIPRELGYIGQETTGAGGFFKALRTIPVILEIAHEMEQHAPGATLVNFTNPAGIITEAVLTHSSVKVIGLCNGPFGTRKAIAQALDTGDAALTMRYFGLNHLSFAANIGVRGRDMTRQVIESFGANQDATGVAILQGLQMVPSSYLQYFYRTAERVAQQQAEEKSRAERVMEIEEELLRLYQNPDLAEKPKILEQRGGAWYSTVATMVIAAIVGSTGEIHIVNTRNMGSIPDLPADSAVEVPAAIDASGATPIAQGPLPLRVRGLVQHVKAYEQLTVQAAVSGDRKTAIWALVNNPLVGTYQAAEQLFDRLLEAHRAYLPAFS